MKKEKQNKKPPLPLSDWEETWEKYWQKAGQTGNELPSDENDPVSFERQFLTGTRTPEKEMERLKRINAEFENGFRKLYKVGPAVTVFGSPRFKEGHPYYELAREVGKRLADSGFAVLTGGGTGLMEAANRGAFEAGGKSLGLNIVLASGQRPNRYVNESIEFNYFFVRKVMLLKYSCAFIIMPGGLGTMDELYEAATLIQCGKIGPFPIILMEKKFWKNVAMLTRNQVTRGAVPREEIGFARRIDKPKDAVEIILKSVPSSVRQLLNR